MEHIEGADKFLEFFVVGAKKIGFSFKEGILEKFYLYYKELVFWNRMVNLTGLESEREQAVLLFADSLAGYLAFPEQKNQSLIDVGSGGGFPGIPLKLACPWLQTSLMEPRGTKTAFLHTVIGKLDLTGISVLQKRLESCKSGNEEEKWDIAITKGVNLETILPHTKNILKYGGILVLFRSSKIENPGKLKGMIIEKEISYELPYGFGTRVISVLKHAP